MMMNTKPKKDFRKELCETVSKLCVPGKGIMEVDEVYESAISKVFSSCGVPATQDSYKTYREIIVTTPGLEKYISGLCCAPETIVTPVLGGGKFVDSVLSRGMLPGVRADKCVYPLPGLLEEGLTVGLDSLIQNIGTWCTSGCKFAVWRSTFKVGGTTCLFEPMLENIVFLSRFASICQEYGLVPVIEIEIATEGWEFTIETSHMAMERILSSIVKCLLESSVFLEGCILCPSLVTGSIKEKVHVSEIACRTLLTLCRTIPPAFPGLMLIKSCLTEEDASLALCEMTKSSTLRKPWVLGFCVSSPYKLLAKEWKGKLDHVKSTQELLISKLSCCTTAALGETKGCKPMDVSSLMECKY